MVEQLHNDKFQINFIPIAGTAFSKFIHCTLFELPYIQKQNEILNNINTTPIYFSITSNQVVDIKKYIDNPFLPKDIADKLAGLYSSRMFELKINDLPETQIIILTTSHYEKALINNQESKGIIKRSNATAISNWESLSTTAISIEAAIIKFLNRNKVTDVNIRRDFKHLYLG